MTSISTDIADTLCYALLQCNALLQHYPIRELRSDGVAPFGPDIEIEIDDVVDLVNSYSSPTRSVAGEMGHDLPQRAVSGRWGTAAVTDSDLITVANRWFEVFAALPDLDRVETVLNSALEEYGAAVRARSDAHTLRSAIVLRGGATEAEQLLVDGYLRLLEWLSTSNTKALGTCAADNCVDVFCDRSPRKNRSYCSPLCQTRERVRRHRRNKERQAPRR